MRARHCAIIYQCQIRGTATAIHCCIVSSKTEALRLSPLGRPEISAGTARVLLIDEVSACQEMSEGDPVSLAIQRTLTWPNRKIIVGGTPLDVGTDVISRLYAESNRQVWEQICPRCGSFEEILWSQIEWPEGHPEEAAWRCPECERLSAEHEVKASRGSWCAERPEAGPGTRRL